MDKESLSVFKQIEDYAKNIAHNIETIGTEMVHASATLDGLMTSGGFGNKSKGSQKSSSSSDGKRIDQLVSSIEKLVMVVSAKQISKMKFGKANLEGLGANINKFIKDMTAGITPADAKAAQFMIEAVNTLGNIGEISKKIKRAVFDLWTVKPFIPLVSKSINSLMKIFTGYSKEDQKSAKTLSEIFSTLGPSIGSFARNLAIATPLLLIGYPAALMMKSIFKLVMKSFEIAGDKDTLKSISSGVSTIRKISTALLLFAGSLAASTLLMGVVGTNIGGLLALVGGVALTMLLFKSLAKEKGDVSKGALGLTLIGLSILALSALLALSTALMPPIASLIPLVLTVGGLAVLYYFMGKEWKNIGFGALSVALMGLSLMLLAKPLKDLAGLDGNLIWKLPLILGGLIGIYAGAGALTESGLLPLGALGIGLIGGSLWVLGKGMQGIVEAVKLAGGIDQKSVDGLSYAVIGTISSIGKAFSGLSMVEALTLPLKIPVVAATGFAIQGLATGIASWKNKVGTWTQDDTVSLSTSIREISKAFATAGSTEGMTKILGFPVGRNTTERGIHATRYMAENLTTLADGIMKWKNMKISQDDMKKVSENISQVLHTIPAIFSTIGIADKGVEGKKGVNKYFNMITDLIPWRRGDVDRGIMSVQNMGPTLSTMYDGIVKWKNSKLTPADLKIISTNVSDMLNVIPGVFAAIGEQDAGTKGKRGASKLFATLVDLIPWRQGMVKRGVDVTKGMFGSLDSIVKAMNAFKDIKDTKVIAQNIIVTVKDIVNGLVNTLTRIGGTNAGVSSYIAGVMKGPIDLSLNLAKTLSEIKGNINKDFSEFGKGVGNMITSINSSLIQIKSSEIKKLSDLINPLERLPKLFKDLNVQLKDHMNYIGKLPKEYVENFKTWSDALKTLSEVKLEKLNDNTSNSKQQLNNLDKGTSKVATPWGTPQTDASGGFVSKKEDLKDKVKDKSDQLMQMLLEQFSNMSTAMTDQTKELTAIKVQLQTGIKTKQSPY